MHKHTYYYPHIIFLTVTSQHTMTLLTNTLVLTCLIIVASITASGQEYLDNNKRFMKLTEVSNDKTYGFDAENPIKVGSNEKAIGAYLNSLKTTDGDKMHVGDLKLDYKKQSGLTMVVLTYEQKKETTTMYFLTTHFEQPKAPVGFLYKTIDDLPKVVLFPADSIVKVRVCSQTLYSVDESLLREKIGDKPKPTISPTFGGGLEELKAYFTANPLTDENTKKVVFRSHIAFIVNCEGNAGNFEIVSNGKGELATYANQVLAVVNKMPQRWQPATVDGQPVDSYQVLSFTIVGGQLDKVSYK